jgi:TonB family protein
MKFKTKNILVTLIFFGLILLAQPIITLSQESDIDAKDETGLTVLMHAAQDADAKEIKKILAKQANLEIKDQFGWTALMYAVASRDVSKVETLLEASADVNTTDNRGITPLMLAALGDKVEIVKLLLSKGASVNATNKKGATALSYAKGKGNSIIAKLFEMAGGMGIELNNSDIPDKLAPVDQTPKPLNVRDAIPKYTEEARQNNVAGKVRLRILVGTDGAIKKIKVVSGLPYGLNEQAVRAASKLKFNPAINEGKPVEYWTSTYMTFSIY